MKLLKALPSVSDEEDTKSSTIGIIAQAAATEADNRESKRSHQSKAVLCNLCGNETCVCTKGNPGNLILV